MRLAVISDIHGNLTALEAVLADLEVCGGADRLWFLGDLAAFGPRPVECIRRIKAFADAASEGDKKGTFCSVQGNTDRYLVTNGRPIWNGGDSAEAFENYVNTTGKMNQALRWTIEQLSFDDYDFLRKVGGECDLTVDGFGTVIGYHAVPGNDEAFLTPETSDEEAADALLDREGRVGIGGHIHRQFDRTLSIGGWRAVNVGSVGVSFDMPGKAQYGLFTFENGEMHVDLRAIPYDLDAVIADLYAVGYPVPEWTERNYRRSG